MRIKGILSFATLFIVNLTCLLRGQNEPRLELTMKGDSMTFQLKSFDLSESWLLQLSTDGVNWSDLVSLESSQDILGFGIKADRITLGIGNFDIERSIAFCNPSSIVTPAFV